CEYTGCIHKDHSPIYKKIGVNKHGTLLSSQTTDASNFHDLAFRPTASLWSNLSNLPVGLNPVKSTVSLAFRKSAPSRCPLRGEVLLATGAGNNYTHILLVHLIGDSPNN
ncbi:hypothetical protein, partial [Arthrobacter rhombi]|uniref:hypothetical protein n=1 Tax=Arthrobacter rhombi TaxID=71253 RepID=UPI003FD4C698